MKGKDADIVRKFKGASLKQKLFVSLIFLFMIVSDVFLFAFNMVIPGVISVLLVLLFGYLLIRTKNGK